MNRFFILGSLYLLFCFGMASGQENVSGKQDSLSYITFENTLQTLEQKFKVRFYYDAERLQQRKVHRHVSELGLDEAMDRLQKLTGYYVIKINNASYVFLPFESKIEQGYHDYVVIGNPLDFGKFSNASIEGKIVDGKTGDPLIGAVVTNEKYKIAANTDKDGKFSIQMPVGDQELTIRFYGYEENNAKLKIFGKGSVQLELFEKSINLDEVVVRAEMAQNGVMRNQMSLVRMDAKGIKELPVSMGEIDIIKGVTLMPGVQSVGEFGSGFTVRGGSADQNLVLMEDLPVFNPSHVFGLISIVNPEDVSSVTLLKAGIPSKYGERASSLLDIKMGGVAPDKATLKGGIGLINSRLSLKVPLFNKKVIWSIGARSSYSDWLLNQIPDEDLQNSSAKFYDLNSMLTITPNGSNRISFFGYYSNDYFKFGTSTRYDYKNMMGGGRWSHVFNSKLSTNVMVGRSKYDLTMEEDLDIPLDWSKINTGIMYDCFRWNTSWNLFKGNTFDFGVNAVRYTNNPGVLSPGGEESVILNQEVEKEHALEVAGYLSDNIEITDKLTLEAGLRMTHYRFLGPYQARYYTPGAERITDNLEEVKTFSNGEKIYSHNGFEPRISAIYKINGESSLKFSYSKVHQYLNLVSNTSVMAPTDVWKLSDNNIKPLSCDQVAVGYYRNITSKFLEASVEVYYKKMNDLIDYKDGANLLMNKAVETDLLPAKGFNYGLELYIKRNSGRLTGWASYTYSRSMRQTTSSLTGEQVNKNKLYPSNFDKPHNIVVQSNYHISKRWRFSATFMYNTGRPTTLPELKYYFQGNQLIYYSERNKYRLPDFHRLDVAITLDESLRLKKKWKGSWTLSIINVYGRHNAFSAFYQKQTPSMSNNYEMFALYKLYIIGFPLPTLTYNFTF